jgi:hypothetical protein
MESFNINKEKENTKNTSVLNKNKWLVILLIIISVIILSAVHFFLSRKNTDFQSRTYNRYPRLQRRNAMKEGEIEKLLSKVDKFSKFTENLRKN